MSAPDLILETQELTKEFKGFVAVDKVNLRVRRGTIHALIGPNGAGKTTCFNLLTKFLTPTSGRILFDGDDITSEKPAAIARRGIVRSFQISAVFAHLSVLENVRVALQRKLGTSFHFWKPESSLHSLDARALELLRDVDLDAVRRPARGRAELRPQARARDRDHAGDGADADAARRADAGHGPRGRRPDPPADQEGRGQPHRADGRAQHERRRLDRRHDHRAARGAMLAEGPVRRGVEEPGGDRGLHGHRPRRTGRGPLDGDALPRGRRACRPGTASRTCCTASTSTSTKARSSPCSAATAPAAPPRCARSWA